MNARVIRRSVVLFATYCVPRVLASRPKLAEPCPVLPLEARGPYTAVAAKRSQCIETVKRAKNRATREGDCEHEGGCRRLTNGDTLH